MNVVSLVNQDSQDQWVLLADPVLMVDLAHKAHKGTQVLVAHKVHVVMTVYLADPEIWVLWVLWDLKVIVDLLECLESADPVVTVVKRATKVTLVKLALLVNPVDPDSLVLRDALAHKASRETKETQDQWDLPVYLVLKVFLVAQALKVLLVLVLKVIAVPQALVEPEAHKDLQVCLVKMDALASVVLWAFKDNQVQWVHKDSRAKLVQWVQEV